MEICSIISEQYPLHHSLGPRKFSSEFSDQNGLVLGIYTHNQYRLKQGWHKSPTGWVPLDL